MKNLYKKHKEIIMYLIFGVLTTLVSLLSYFVLAGTVLDATNALQLQICNILSWISAVTFAYFTNKHFVFNQKGNNIGELVSFYLSRVFTLLVDMLIMFVFVSLLKFNDAIVKFAVQVIVIVLNYILSKFLVFRAAVKNIVKDTEADSEK